MYAIPKDTQKVKAKYGVNLRLDISQICKITRTPACKPGEYALFVKDDNDKKKFSIFCGYIDFNRVCDSFEMVNYHVPKGT